MEYTKGPWELVSTVSSDRKNLFGVSPYREYHIGTLVSGSLSNLELFRANLSLITNSPSMYELLIKINQNKAACGFDKQSDRTNSDPYDLFHECGLLLSKINRGCS